MDSRITHVNHSITEQYDTSVTYTDTGTGAVGTISHVLIDLTGMGLATNVAVNVYLDFPTDFGPVREQFYTFMDSEIAFTVAAECLRDAMARNRISNATFRTGSDEWHLTHSTHAQYVTHRQAVLTELGS